MVPLIEKYFPDLSASQLQRFAQLQPLYEEWNARINVVSRKDISLLVERHVLHSLAIAKIVRFEAGNRVIDVGTGGGFPGIPLAIMFPEASFTLVDSIAKKIKVVQEVASALKLENVSAQQARAEAMQGKFDFAVSRAVTSFPELYGWIRQKIAAGKCGGIANGIIALKGGDLEKELGALYTKATIYRLSDFFEEPFFETKMAVYMPA